MDNNSHIVRRDEAYYPSAGYGAWSEERLEFFKEHSTIIHHPIYDPRPVKKKPRAWAQALAWALTALGLAGS